MKLLIAFTLTLTLSLVNCRPVREINTCIASFLKSNGYQIDDGTGSDAELNPLCTVIVEVMKSQILSSFKRQIDSNDNEKVDSQCIVRSLEHQGFTNEALVLVILDDLELSEDQRNTLKTSTQKKIADYVFNAYLTCDGEKKFGNEFEKLFDEDSDSSDEKTDSKEDYCTRRHIVKHNLIKVKGVSLIENPNKIDTSTIDCTRVYKKVLTQAEDELVEHINGKSSSEDDNEQHNTAAVTVNNECLLKVIRNENFIDRMIPFDYVKELSLSPEQRQQLKEQFVHVMKQLSLHTRKCID